MKIGLWAAVVVSLPLAVGGLRSFLSRDPFGYFTDKWADPFGGDIGSVMKDVDAVVYEKGVKKASFVADQVDIRRDKQFMDLFGLQDGKVFENNQEQASFSAGRATFNAAEELMMIFGGAQVTSKDFDLKTPDAKLDIKNQRAVMSNGIEGTAFKGSVRAGKLELGLGTGKHRASAVIFRSTFECNDVFRAVISNLLRPH